VLLGRLLPTFRPNVTQPFSGGDDLIPQPFVTNTVLSFETSLNTCPVTRRHHQNTRISQETAVENCNLGSEFSMQYLHETQRPVHFNIILPFPHTCSTFLFPSVIPVTNVCPFLPLNVTDAFRRRPLTFMASQSSVIKTNTQNLSLCSFSHRNFPYFLFGSKFSLNTLSTNSLGLFSSLLSRGDQVSHPYC
jgi:hypothetical protein